MSTLEIVAMENGVALVGCTHCRAVWPMESGQQAQCPVCGVENSSAQLWRVWTGAAGTTDYRPHAPWSSQAHRTAMLLVLIATVSVYALALCARFLAETP